jgi:hypothetical protein
VIAPAEFPIFIGNFGDRKCYAQLLSNVDELSDMSELRRLRFLDEDVADINGVTFDVANYDERRATFFAASNSAQLFFGGNREFFREQLIIPYAEMPFAVNTVNYIHSVGNVRKFNTGVPSFDTENGFLFLNVNNDETYRYWLHSGNSEFIRYDLLDHNNVGDQRFANWQPIPSLSGKGLTGMIGASDNEFVLFAQPSTSGIVRYSLVNGAACRLAFTALGSGLRGIATTDQNITSSGLQAYAASSVNNFDRDDIEDLTCGTTSVTTTEQPPVEWKAYRTDPTRLKLSWSRAIEQIDIYTLNGQLISSTNPEPSARETQMIVPRAFPLVVTLRSSGSLGSRIIN